jgi:hypothetical protein
MKRMKLIKGIINSLMAILRIFIVVVFSLLKVEPDNINIVILKMRQHICMEPLANER